MSEQEGSEKEKLEEILAAMEDNLAEIAVKLQNIEILLFFIALPVIIGLIFLLIALFGIITLPLRYP